MVGAWCFAIGALACAPLATAGPGCAEVGPALELARELEETSGLAVGRRDPEVLWTHNDGDSDLFAMDRTGRVLARFAVAGGFSDWEDIEIGACVESATCLYLADTGDNGEGRPAGDIRILRVAEPTLGSATAVLEADVFPIRLPDGPRDVEALFVLPGEVPYLVTKGANHPVTVYRYPGLLRPDTVTLEEVQRLTDGPEQLLNRVTGASASPDGRRVAVRTYQSMRFYRVEEGSLMPAEDGFVNLRTLREIQGEGVGLGPDGLAVLTSEGGPLGGPPSLRLLRCRLVP